MTTAERVDEFIRAGRRAKATNGAILAQLSPETIRAAAQELARLRADERRRAALARKNGRAGGRPRAPDAEIKPASLKRREYRAK
jgi:hypothetical protein